MKTTKRDEPNETTEMWRQVHREQADRREARREHFTRDIMALREHGYRVERLTDFHFRVEGRLDLFPTSTRYHFLPTNKRGGYVSALSCTVRFLSTSKGTR